MKTSSKFPEKYTEEEEELLQKYALLKTLRKQLTELRSRQAAEAETSREKEEPPVKPSEDARVAAERLVKLGKIKIQSACQPRILMKKGRDSAGPAAYRPYSPTEGTQAPLSGDADQQQPAAKRPRANLYDSFVSGGVQDPASSQGAATSAAAAGEPAQRRGNTLFVQGYNIHTDMLRAAFSPFGIISRISMETRGRFNDAKANKPKAFVTFESDDDAAKALEQLDGQLVKGSVLSVRLARKQLTGPQHRGGQRGAYGSDWGDGGGGGGGGGRRRGGLGYDAEADDADGLAGSSSSPRYAPPGADESAASESPAAASAASATAAAVVVGSVEEAETSEQRRPLEYSDGVFVSSDPMEEDAIAELEEVM